MGIRLVMEAAGRAPAGLTWRERYALLVLAASAMDATRECPPGIERSADITERLRLGRSERFAVIESLCAKGALVRLERGRNGVLAVYAIAPFGPATGTERPGDPDVPPVDSVDNPVDNPAKRPGNPDASRSAKGPGSADEASGKPGRKRPGNPDASRPDTVLTGIKGFKTGGETPLPPAQRPLFPSALPDVPPEEGGHSEGGKPAPRRDACALAAEIRKMRPEWSTRSILRALEKPSVTERPWPLACEAMRVVAADQQTQHPGRLEHEGPWWTEAARRVIAPAPERPPWCGECDETTRMLGMDGDKPRRCPKCKPEAKAS